MRSDNLVDAALAGFDQGELVTIPSLPDAADWDAYEAARQKLIPNLSLSVCAGAISPRRCGLAQLEFRQRSLTSISHGHHRIEEAIMDTAVGETFDRRRRRDRGAAAIRPSLPSRSSAAIDVAGVKSGTKRVWPAQADQCRRAEYRLCRSRSRRWRARHPAARLALRHPYLCRCCSLAGDKGVSRDRALSAGLRRHALPVERDDAATGNRRQSPSISSP